MQQMSHSITVNAEKEVIYKLCADVERWPEIFPPCKSAKVLSFDGRQQEIEITAEGNGQVSTWTSIRELYPETLAIAFRQTKPVPLLSSMEGVWRFHDVDAGTLIVLDHSFSVKDDPSGLMPGISTRASAIDFMRRAIDTNSVKELASIRTHVETSNANAMRNAKRFSFEERMTISAPVESIYNALWDVARWPSLLPYCLNVDLRYDDQYRHQEFIMTVEAGGEVERLRTVRIGTPNKRIEYFQVNPPPALISHSGEWLINQGENGAELISAHTVAANYEYVRKRWGEMPESVMEEKIRNSINGNSLSTMLLIKKSLEQ